MIQSLLYRLIITGISIWIVIHKTIEIIPIWSYFVIMLVYLITYWYLKKHEKSILRLLLDYIFINIVIYHTDIYSSIIFLLIILPIINAINFSGKSSHYFLLIILTCLTFLLQTDSIQAEAILSILLLSVMYGYSKLRTREWIIEKEISQHIDTYFLNPEQIEKPHQIYKKIIDDLNRFFYYEGENGIERISAYILKGNTLWLVNSSEFVWQRKKHITEQEAELLREKTILEFKDEFKLNSWYYVRRENMEYVFCCEMLANFQLKLHNYKKILELTFSKASMLLNADYRIRNMRDKKFDEIKDNVLYVNQAVKVMHYIRNKMTPLSNVLAYYKISEKIQEPIKLQMRQRIDREAKQADADLKEILQFANYLLDKSNNPFIESESTEVSIMKLFIVMSEIVERHMDDIVHVDDSLQKVELDKYFSYLNLVECKIMLTDWVTNMNRYYKKIRMISMGIQNDKLIFHFENDYSCSEGEINKLVQDLNSNGKDAVIEGKGNGHGISIIKSIANKLNIDIIAKVDYKENIGNIICLDLKFAIYERKENSNI